MLLNGDSSMVSLSSPETPLRRDLSNPTYSGLQKIVSGAWPSNVLLSVTAFINLCPFLPASQELK